MQARVIALGVFTLAFGCVPRTVDMAGRPCSDSAECVERYDCDTSKTDGPTCVTTGDACESTAGPIECAEPGQQRFCVDGSWSDCLDCEPGASCGVECNPGSTWCSALEFFSCTDEGRVGASVDCSTASMCQGAGVCDDVVGCSVVAHAPLGTPCDEGPLVAVDGDFCNSTCDGSGGCVDVGVACADTESCADFSCNTTTGACDATPVDCSSTATPCLSAASCDPASTEDNCDMPGSSRGDGNPCTPCTSGDCTCDSGACIDNLACVATESCNLAADCGLPGGTCPDIPTDCQTFRCTGQKLERQACADVTLAGWAVGAPCVASQCAGDNYDGSQAIGADCLARGGGGNISMVYTFTTASSNGTPFNLWMRNMADTDVQTAAWFDCSLTGVTGVGTMTDLTLGETDLLNGRHGPRCNSFDSGNGYYCWMALDGNTDPSSYDPISLDQGEHELSCTAGPSSTTDEPIGYDGIILTSDLSFIPDNADTSTCGDNDTTFTAGDCSNNWNPNSAPALGTCTLDVPVVDGRFCSVDAGNTCCSGSCLNRPTDGECP